MKDIDFYSIYESLRKCLLSKTTRQELNKFLKQVPILQDRRNIFLFRYSDEDFCLFFWACVYQMNNIIDFSINNCNIPINIKQSFEELEKKFYECNVCRVFQCNIDKTVKEEFTPLFFAIWSGKKVCVENLLSLMQQWQKKEEKQQQQQQFINEESYPSGITALQLACSMNSIDIVKCLIYNWNADVNKLDKYGKTSLMYTLLGGNDWKICLLLKREIKEKEEERRDEEEQKLKICQLLLENGVSKVLLYEKDKVSGLNAIDICQKLGYNLINKLFLQYI